MENLDDIAGRLTVAAVAFAVAGLALAALGTVALGNVRAAEKWPSAPHPRVGRPIALTSALLGLVVLSLAAGLFCLVRIGTGLDTNLRVLIAVGIDLIVLTAGVLAVNLVAGKIEVRALIAVPQQPTPPPPIPVSGDPTRYQVPDVTEVPADANGTLHAPEPRQPSPPPVMPPQPPPYAPDTAATGSLRTTVHTSVPAGVPTIPTDTKPGWVFQDRGTGAYYAAVAQSRGGIGLLALDDFTVARTAALVGPLELVGSVEATVWPLENSAAD